MQKITVCLGASTEEKAEMARAILHNSNGRTVGFTTRRRTGPKAGELFKMSMRAGVHLGEDHDEDRARRRRERDDRNGLVTAFRLSGKTSGYRCLNVRQLAEIRFTDGKDQHIIAFFG